MEKAQIRRALDAAGGRVGEAAALLGIDRKTLRRKIQDLEPR
jgi:transcriptional regulator of acetoin/glycerol metabolism